MRTISVLKKVKDYFASPYLSYKLYNCFIMETAVQQPTQEVYDFAAGLMAKGLPDETIQSQLREQGLDTESVTTITSSLRAEFVAYQREEARKNMLHGGLWLLGGCAVTGVTFALASDGGSYVMTWGAVIFGGFQFLKGVYQHFTRR